MSKVINNIQGTSLGIKLRYEILKDFLDIPSVLKYLGIKYTKAGDECMGNCPYHNDRHPSWSIKWDKTSPKWGVHSCFSCKVSGNVVSLTRDLLNLSSYSNALSWLEEFSGLNKTDLDIESILLDRRLNHNDIKKIENYGLIDFNFPPVRSNQLAYNYLKFRGVTESQIDTHGICSGTEKYVNSVVFPIRNEYGVSTFYARFYKGETKGLYAAGKDKIKNTLYGFYNCDLLISTCYLVEGCFDALAVERALIHMGSKAYRNVFATLGPILYQPQSKLLEFFTDIVIIPDMKGGAQSLVPSCKDLLDSQNLWVVEVTKGEDPDSEKNLGDKLNNAVDARKTFNTLVIDYGI